METQNSIASLRSYVKELRRSGRARPLVAILQSGWDFGKKLREFALATVSVVPFRKATEGKDLPELVDIVMSGFGGLVRPFQNQNELTWWIQRVASVSPNVVVEIGTAKGGTFFLHSRAAQRDATMISIDLPGGLYGGGYPFWKKWFYRRLIGSGKSIQFIRENSHDPKTRAELERRLGGKKIDVLFIDGDHTYEGVKQDFWLYAPLVRPGGLVGLHDISNRNCNDSHDDILVWKFWDELKPKAITEEIVDPAEPTGRFGIGVVVVPESGLP